MFPNSKKKVFINDIEKLDLFLSKTDFNISQNFLLIKGKNILSSSFTYQIVLNKIDNWIKQKNTENFFKKVWNRNILFNYKQNKKILSEYIPPERSSVAILVSTGPSLEKEISKLIICKKELEEKICIVAAPSAVEFLNYHNITPNFIISTDGGFSNEYHFKYLYRIQNPPPLIAPYSIQKNIIKNYTGEIYFFFDGLDWITENCIHILSKEIFSKISENCILPASSVTGVALRVLQYFFYKHIATIGVDFEITPFLFHSISNSLEEFFFQKGSRLYPFENWYQKVFFQKIKKKREIWIEPKLEVYYNQFQKIIIEKGTNLTKICELKKYKNYKRLIPIEITKNRLQATNEIKKFLQKYKPSSHNFHNE